MSHRAIGVILGVCFCAASAASAGDYARSSVGVMCIESAAVIEAERMLGEWVRVDHVYFGDAVKAGDLIRVRDLDRMSLETSSTFGFQASGLDHLDSGQRMWRLWSKGHVVLFLDRDAKGWRPLDTHGSGSGGVMWIDGDDVYAYDQIMNPGGMVLMRARAGGDALPTLDDLRGQIGRSVRTTEPWRQTLHMSDARERAARLVAFLADERWDDRERIYWPVSWDTHEELHKLDPEVVLEALLMYIQTAPPDQPLDHIVNELANVGEGSRVAVQMLRKMLANPGPTSVGSILSALRQIGDRTVASDARRFVSAKDPYTALQAIELLVHAGDVDSFDLIAARVREQADGAVKDDHTIRQMIEAMQRLDAQRAKPVVAGLRDLPGGEIVPAEVEGDAKEGYTVQFRRPVNSGSRYTTTDLMSVARLKRLRSLDIDADYFESLDLSPLGQLEQLDWLRISSAHLTDAGCRAIAANAGMRELSLNMVAFDSGGVGRLSRLQSLRQITISGDHVTADLSSLEFAAMPNLEPVYLGDVSLTRENVEAMAKLPHLKVLTFSGVDAPSGAFAAIGRAEGLENLQLYGDGFAGAIATINPSGWTKLYRLAISFKGTIPAVFIQKVATLPALQWLQLNTVNTERGSLRYLRTSPLMGLTLESLDGESSLADCPRLHRLQIYGPVTAADVDALVTMKQLEQVELSAKLSPEQALRLRAMANLKVLKYRDLQDQYVEMNREEEVRR